MLGLPGDDTRLEFPLLPEDYAGLRMALPVSWESRRPLVGLHPGARSAARRWPVEYFAEVGDVLARRHGATIVVTAGPAEGDLANAVISRMTGPAINLAERTTIGGLAALLQSIDLFISNDTGPAHLAVALDRPSITIFGPADRRRWAPLDQGRHRVAFHDVPCSPCPHLDCPIDHRCLRGLAPGRVLDLADDVLKKTVAGAPS
jgi:ADP-heptose:LPS heptosyltransferase